MYRQRSKIHKFAFLDNSSQKMIITLTSDFGLKDPHVGILKGLLYSGVSGINVVDISHEISPFSIQETLYVIDSSYYYFPEKTIHIIMVDAQVSEDKKPIIMFWNNHYFLSSDNGILSMLCSIKKPEWIVAAQFYEKEETIQLFVRLACEIAKETPILKLGQPIDSLKEQTQVKPVVFGENNRITGTIIYINRYGNAISNISRDLFEKTRNGRPFELLFRTHRLTKIHSSYIEYESEENATIGGQLAVFNRSGLLEIGLYRGNQKSGGTAATLLGLEHESSVTIYFLS